MFINDFDNSELATGAADSKYGVRFSFENNVSRAQTSEEGEINDGRLSFMDARTVGVNDTLTDKLLNVVLVKLTAIGKQDVVVCSGQVPGES